MLSRTTPKLKRERLVTISGIRGVQISFYSIIASFLVFSFFLSIEGVDPFTAYQNMFSFAFDPQLGLPLTIHRSMLILFSTLAFIIPLRAGFWNIGMEGQFYLGTIGAFFVAYSLPDYPSEVLIPLMILSGMVFGALYGAVAGVLRGRFNVNEVVVTLMLNNIAFWMVYLLTVGGPWAGIAESTSRPLPKNAQAPFIFGTPFTTFVAIAFAFITHFFLSKTVAGFRIRILGHSPTAARFVGIDEFKTAVLVMSLGGALAGIAGYHMWAGDPAYLRIPRPDAYKAIGDLTYWGIIIGLVCLLNAIPAMPASFFIGSIIVGSTVLGRRFKLPFGLDFLFLGIISIIFATFQFFLYYRIKVRGK